jgi:hypothetical protein
MKKLQEEILPRIARYLMLHGSFINNTGLLNGMCAGWLIIHWIPD